MEATVSSKGQVTIPKPLRDALGLDSGTKLRFREESGRLVATKVRTTDPITEVFGILHSTRTTDEVIEELRGPAARPSS